MAYTPGRVLPDANDLAIWNLNETPPPYLWTVNNSSNEGFSQLLVSDGSLVCQVQPGLAYSSGEGSLLNDGKGNVWAARRLAGTDSIIKIDALTGVRLGGMDRSINAWGNQKPQIAFDGTNYWYHTFDYPNLRCIDINLGAVRTVQPKSGYRVQAVIYDGVGNIWASYYDYLGKVRASDGAVLGEVEFDFWYDNSAFLLSDKTSVWVVRVSGGSYWLKAVRISDFAITTYGPYTGSISASVPGWDGTNLWVLEAQSGTGYLDKIRAADGALVGHYSLPSTAAQGVYFDGVNLWIMNGGPGGKLLKMTTNGITIGTYPSGGESGSTFGVAFTNIVMPWP
jgi:hypothetical protein